MTQLGMPEVVFENASMKEKAAFRDYEILSPRQATVVNHYRMMRQNQTLDFVQRMHAKYSFADGQHRCVMSIQDAFRKLDGYVDSSDPDLSLPNIIHSYQTAEALRKAGKPDWMQLIGLIHDMGKLMFLWGEACDGQQGTAEGPQWALGGDTFVVGAKLPDCCVFPEFNSLNPDSHNPERNTELGIYTPQCGLQNVLFAYGHDEYLYQMLVANGCTIPPEGYYMVRFHSAYPWHTGGAYSSLINAHDLEMLPHVLEFNKFDLYTKDELGQLSREQGDALWPHYHAIIQKYFPDPENLKW